MNAKDNVSFSITKTSFCSANQVLLIILWDLLSMLEVKEYFILSYSTRFYFISLILDAFLQWNSLIFSHGLLNLSSEMYNPFILYHGTIPNWFFFQDLFQIHNSFLSLLDFSSVWFYHWTSHFAFHSFRFIKHLSLAGRCIMPYRHKDEWFRISALKDVATSGEDKTLYGGPVVQLGGYHTNFPILFNICELLDNTMSIISMSE